MGKGAQRRAHASKNASVERSEKRARLSLPPHNLAVTLKRKVRGWPGEMLLLPSAEAQYPLLKMFSILSCAFQASVICAYRTRHKINFSHYQCDLLHKVSKETATLTIAPRPGGEGYGDFALARSASGSRLRALGRMSHVSTTITIGMAPFNTRFHSGDSDTCCAGVSFVCVHRAGLQPKRATWVCEG